MHAVNKSRGETKCTAAGYLLISGDAMNTFLNENWRLIYNEVGKDISMSLGQIVLDIIKESATSVPYNEIFDDVE